MTNRRHLILLSGMVAFFFSGMIYGWSILKVPLSSELGYSITDLSINFTVTMCAFCIGGICSGIMQHRISPRFILIIASVLGFAGFGIASSLQPGQIHLLYLSYGIMAGFSIGLQYNTILSVTSAWFKDKNGSVSGALLMSFGSSALICGMIADSLINSSVGWRKTYLVLGIVIMATSLLAAFTMTYPPTEVTTHSSSNNDVTPKQMVKKGSFWKLFIFLIFAASIGNSTISFARDLAVSIGATSSLASLLAGILSLCNGLGRLVVGIIYDKKGRRFTMTLDGIVTIIAPSILLSAVITNNLSLCIIGLCITGLSYAFQPPITSSVTASFYGSRYFSVNYSILNLMLIPTSIIASINGFLYSKTLTYIAPLSFLLILSIISFFININIKHA